MERIESGITAQGQVSVPARIRRRLGLTPGSKIEWCESGGEVAVCLASLRRPHFPEHDHRSRSDRREDEAGMGMQIVEQSAAT